MRKLISKKIVEGVTPSKKQLVLFKQLKKIDDMLEKYPNCCHLKAMRSLTVFLIKMN